VYQHIKKIEMDFQLYIILKSIYIMPYKIPYKDSYKKKYYDLNKEKFTTIIHCSCGGKHQIKSSLVHKKSALHIRWEEQQKKLIQPDDVEILDFKLIISKLDGEYIPFNQSNDIEYIYTI